MLKLILQCKDEPVEVDANTFFKSFNVQIDDQKDSDKKDYVDDEKDENDD